MSSKSRRDLFTDHMRQCVRYWILCGLSRHRIEMLKSEMEVSIRAAIKRGDNPEEIFGTPKKWARTQYRIYRKEQSRARLWNLRLLGFVCHALLIGTATVVMQHFFYSATSFPLDARTIGFVAALTCAVSLAMLPGLSFLSLKLGEHKKLRIRGEYLCLAAGLVVGTLLLPHSTSEPASGLLEWTWVQSSVLTLLTIIVGIVHFRLDPTRFISGDPAYDQLPLVSLDKSDATRKRKRDRLALSLSLCLTACFGLLWLTLPPGERETIGAWLIAYVCWSLFLLYSELANRNTGENCASQ